MIAKTGAKFRRTIIVLLAPCMLAATSHSIAQVKTPTAPGFSWNVEGQVRYDDNVYRSAFDEVDDTVFVLMPSLSWLFLSGAHQFDLSYAGNYGAYVDEDNLDFTNHKFGAHALLDHTARLSTDYVAGYELGYDAPGTTDAIDLRGESPNEWEAADFTAKIEYGKSSSTGQLVGQFNLGERSYTNNDQEFRDYESLGGIGTFYYLIAPRTRLLFELDYTDYDYQNQDVFGSDQSSQQYLYLTGATWEATAKTTGVFKIGYRDRQYDNDRFGDQNGLYFSLDGIWEPTSFTTVTLTASQENQESAQQATGGYVRTGFNAALQHGITPRIQLTGNIGYSKDDFEGGLDRSDDRFDVAVGAQYSLLHWLDIGAEYRYEDRDSDRALFDFTANVIMLRAVATFDP